MQGIVVVNKVVEFRGEAVTPYRDGHAHCNATAFGEAGRDPGRETIPALNP
ncbi:hypothetical protein [Mesorhizobium sp. M7A.F.Ca.CA.001.11.2.1]|uniref:hypothetical protein n=1 Tax=Mesorhizobium sp. M7A.F.Ca.CA.001.11.2.1 TaxID=2496693 RepID=UPI0013E046C6|nr:hypothetical protein [Mesorhizobium sp. M7A.F.Ca.CA.001.11.2.1]